MYVDTAEIKHYIELTGLKQRAIAQRAGMDEAKLCMVLQGKRKLEAGEYAGICNAIGVPMTEFVKPHVPEETAS